MLSKTTQWAIAFVWGTLLLSFPHGYSASEEREALVSSTPIRTATTEAEFIPQDGGLPCALSNHWIAPEIWDDFILPHLTPRDITTFAQVCQASRYLTAGRMFFVFGEEEGTDETAKHNYTLLFLSSPPHVSPLYTSNFHPDGKPITFTGHKISLKEFCLTPEDLKVLAKYLPEQLRILELSDSIFGDEVSNTLFSSLPKSLQILQLNYITINSSTALAFCLPNLQQLSMAGSILNDEHLECLANALSQSKSTRLKYLDLSTNEFGPRGVIALAAALGECTILEHLDLSANSIGDTGLKYLARSLSTHSSLQYLNISDCNVDGIGEGVMDLAEVLSQHPRLSYLNLSMNSLGNKGLQALADTMMNFENLQFLGLSCEIEQEEDREAFAQILSRSTGLIHLKLGHSRLDSESFDDLILALPQFHSLLTLDLNSLNTEFIESSSTVLELNCKSAIRLAAVLPSTIRTLILHDNLIGDKGAMALINKARTIMAQNQLSRFKIYIDSHNISQEISEIASDLA